MPLPWSDIARFLKWVVPLVPVVLDNVATFRRTRPPAGAGKTVEAQLAHLDQAITEQERAVEKLLERVEQLVVAIHGLQRALAMVLVLAIAALVVAIFALIIAVTYGK